MKLFIKILTIFIWLTPLSGVGQITFNKKFHFDANAVEFFSVETAEDGYYFSGIAAFDTFTLFTTKLDLEGNELWTKFQDGPHASLLDIEDTFQKTPDGNFVGTGFTWDENGLEQGFLYWRNQDGDSLRLLRLYSDYAFEEPIDGSIPSIYAATSLTQDEDGNLYQVARWTEPYSIIRKFSPEGEILWTHVHTHSDNMTGYRLFRIRYHNGLVYHTYLEMFGTEQDQYLAISDPNTGERLETILIDDLNLTIEDFAVEEDQEEYIFASVRSVPGIFGGAATVTKTNNQGEILWNLQVGDANGGFRNSFKRIEKASDGNYVASGIYYEKFPEDELVNGLYDYDGMLLKFTSAGEPLWLRRYRLVTSLYDNHVPSDMKPTPDGGYIFCGEVVDGDTNGPNFVGPRQQAWVVKVDQYGCLEPGCQFTSVEEITIGLENSMQIAPNPVDQECKISFDLPTDFSFPQNSEVRIFDLTGKLVLQEKVTSKDQLTINVQSLKSGEYIIHWLNETTLFDSVKLVKF